MLASRFKNVFDTYFEAPISVWEHFASLGELVRFKKNEVIKECNTIEKYGYFLLSGACGLFVWRENSYVCLDLILENNFFADDISLNTREPTKIEIISLEKSEVFRISRENIYELKKTEIGSQLFRAGSEKDYNDKQKQHLEYLTKTAEERYMDLLESRPELLNRISQKHIASYLGVTTQSLSRIRKKISRLKD